MRLGVCLRTGALVLVLVDRGMDTGPLREDRGLVLMVMVMDTVMDTGGVMDTGEVATLVAVAVEVAAPKGPAPAPAVADRWSPPASATVRAKTPKWRIG